jgi:hypothetical protein
VYNAIYNRRSKFSGPSLNDFLVTSLLNSENPEKISFNSLPNLHFRKPKFWGHAAAKKIC